MPKHIHPDNYLANPYALALYPKIVIHPDIQRHPTDVEHYMLPAVFTIAKHDVRVKAKYPGPGVYYIIEGDAEYEDMKNPGVVVKVSAGGVIHIEEGTVLRATSPNIAKCFGVFWVPVSVKSFDSFIVPE